MADRLVVRGVVEQSVADTGATTSYEEKVIDTGLGVLDQKTVWRLIRLDVHWVSAVEVVWRESEYYDVRCSISRKENAGGFLDEPLVGAVNWTAQQGSPVGGGMVPIDSIKSYEFADTPLIANSRLFIGAFSAGTFIPNKLAFRLFYEETKVTELEFLKLQSGYCVC